MSEFKCIACGKCCAKIRGKLSKEETDFLKEYGYGKLPIIQLTKLGNITFPLWDWEAKRFKEHQTELNLDAKIKPLRAIFDLNTNKTIITAYFMDSDSCPFLKEDGKCKIYDKKRAYICRLYPFNKSPFLETGDSLKETFGSCPEVAEIVNQIPEDKDKAIVFLKESFSDGTLTNAVQNDLIAEWLNQTILGLIKSKLIRPAMNYPYEFLKKRIDKSESIDFTDFLVESGYKTREEITRLIDSFDNNKQAKERLNLD